LGRIPWLKLLIIVELGMRLQEHVGKLNGYERRELAELLRHSTSLTPRERNRVRWLVRKMELGSFLAASRERFTDKWR